MSYYENASNGLGKMYSASIGTIVCAFFMYIPFIGFFAAIVAIGFAIINLMGYYAAGKDIVGCKVAFGLQISYLIIYTLVAVLGNASVVADTLIRAIPSVAVVVVLFSTADTLRNIGAVERYDQGIRAGWIYLICNIVVVIATVNVSLLEASGEIEAAAVISMGSSVFSILALVYQLRFLKSATEEFNMYGIKKMY